MARRPARPQRSAEGADSGPLPYDMTPGVLLTFRTDDAKTAVQALTSSAGIKNVAYAADFDDEAVDMGQARGAGMLVFDRLGVAVADVDPDQGASVSALAAADGAVVATEPEPIFTAYADGPPPDFTAYLRGYRDAVNHIYDQAVGPGAAALLGAAPGAAPQNTPDATWGLIASKIVDSKLSGRGVRVAILDTGLDLDHPDFRTRAVTGESFIPGQSVQDDNGHGTHCVGTACGPRSPTKGPRYGVAFEAEIFAGKVLTNQGFALGRSTIAGLNWAVANGCRVVSMSLGAPVQPGERHLVAFERIARDAMRRNTLVIAAAGNDSKRSQGRIKPVSNPANCPSVLAVAAVDRFLRTAEFSNGSINPDGRVDIAAPGVDVYSSAPEPAATPQPSRFRQWSAQYDTISGTSMATPHVAGVAALLLGENPGLTAPELCRLLTARARSLPQSASDVGAGLLQA